MKLKILLTNDDGFEAPGLVALRRELEKWGECFTAAPMSERSASGHSVTLREKIAVKKCFCRGKLTGFSIDGTPADCVKFALVEYYQKNLPDIVVSGLNPGPNIGASIYYSGTIAAAREAIFARIPAFATSVASYTDKNFSKYSKIAVDTIKKIYAARGRENYFYNINIPAGIAKPRGIQLTHQSHSRFEEEFVPVNGWKKNQAEYYLRGSIELLKETGESDEEALREGYVSVTPCQLDVSAYPEIARLEKKFHGR